MSLADSITQAEAEASKGTVCSVTIAKESMKPEDIKVLEAALYNRAIKASVLAKAFEKEKIDISAGTITRHRNGNCKSC